jgi:hypothetical protein
MKLPLAKRLPARYKASARRGASIRCYNYTAPGWHRGPFLLLALLTIRRSKSYSSKRIATCLFFRFENTLGWAYFDSTGQYVEPPQHRISVAVYSGSNSVQRQQSGSNYRERD